MGKITRQELSENLNNEIDTIQEDIDTLDTNLNLVQSQLIPYESGTWLPSWGTTSSYGSLRIGSYIKIGKLCFVQCRISLESKGDAGPTITGLPFSSNSGLSFQTLALGQSGNISFGTSEQLMARVSGTEVLIVKMVSGSPITTIGNPDLADNSYLSFSGCYIIE